MEKLQRFEQAMKREWYTQGFNAVPIFLNHAAWSGMVMKKDVGYGYTHFFYRYQDGYGEMSYDPQDFKRIWRIIKRKLKADPGYLKKLKKRYKRMRLDYRQFFTRLDRLDERKMSDQVLIHTLKICCRSLTDGVSFAHLIEAVGIEAEAELKALIAKHARDPKTQNQYFARLTAPTKPSFLKIEENELLDIAKLPAAKQSKALERHAHKYFWMQNNYAAPRELKPAFFARRMRQLRKHPKIEQSAVPQDAAYRLLAKAAKPLTGLIDYCTIWQDERKANILESIGYMDRMLHEMARRVHIPVTTIYHLGSVDVERLQTLSELPMLRKELERRAQGCYSLIAGSDEWFATGEDYRKLRSQHDRASAHQHESSDLHGSVANGGTAVGKVVICKSLEAIKKVKAGDILVASMTRPEFMPALKKAAAIVTDEGGITSHAAIVARELNIPAIIGTKIATKVLKDGDTVEVRANHGIVRIL